MIPMTAWGKPKIIKQDRWKKQPNNATRGNWERERTGEIHDDMDKPGWEH